VKNMPFKAQFDFLGLGLSFLAICILFYYGLVYGFIQELWVAFGFWFVGFFGSYFLVVTQRSRMFNLYTLITTSLMAGVLIAIDLGLQYAFAIATRSSIDFGAKLMSMGIGISEELFFGIFALGFLINWLHFPSPVAIIISSASHSWYHAPQWGTNPILLTTFFVGFLVTRSIYVYLFPKVGCCWVGMDS